jgi:hypothetical protein
MFYCDKCRKKYNWPESMCKSRGKCEICDKISSCNDVPSSRLPSKKTVKKKSGRK